MSKSLSSAVSPTDHGENYLHQAITNVLNQSFLDFEAEDVSQTAQLGHLEAFISYLNNAPWISSLLGIIPRFCRKGVFS